MKTFLKFFLPFLVLLGAGLLSRSLIQARVTVQPEAPPAFQPLIRVIEVQQSPYQFSVESQGSVEPRGSALLNAEVGGRLVYLSPALLKGNFFRRGELLARIDDEDYKLAVVLGEAEVAQAQVRLEREEAEAEIARKEWQSFGQGEPTALVLRKPQVAEAKAVLAAAKANLEKAQLNLKRTEIRAPFQGRVLENQAGLGQVLQPGNAIASLFLTERVHVILPIPDQELAYIELPLGEGSSKKTEGSEIRLTTTWAGQRHEWPAQLIGTTGRIDPQSRMVNLVAIVEKPYEPPAGSARPPLAIGTFVQAEIQGRRVEQTVQIPRSALRDGNQVLVLGEDGRLRSRTVQVLRREDNSIVLGGGLRGGETVCVSQMEAFSEGMRVRTLEDLESGEAP